MRVIGSLTRELRRHYYRCGFPFISFNACWIWVRLALLLSPPAGRVARTSGPRAGCSLAEQVDNDVNRRAAGQERARTWLALRLYLLLDILRRKKWFELDYISIQSISLIFRNARGRTTIKMLNFDRCERKCAALHMILCRNCCTIEYYKC